MNPWTQNPKLPPGRFRIGDRVRILYGFHGIEGEIAADRGHIGFGGRRVYDVTLKMGEGNNPTAEFAEDELEAVPG